MVKLPTGAKNAGVSTGKMDVEFDFIASKDAAQLIDLAGYGGYEYRGSPDGFQIPTGAFRWGGGAAFPSHRLLRIFGEMDGVLPSSDTTTITTGMAKTLDASGAGGAPLTSNTENLTRLTTGVMVGTRRGFFVGLGGSWNMPKLGRDPARAASLSTTDYWDWQVRVGFHPGVRAYAAPVAEAAPPPPPPPTPVPIPNRGPTVDATCDPCTVPIGTTSTITATGRDPDGDVLAYHWSAPTGALTDAARPQTIWTAPQEEGPVTVTVAVDDGRSGTASALVRIDVVRPPIKRYTFEDVHFDLDVYSLRPEALRVLDEAVTALADDPALSVTIDGHTCNIGTAEYNLALGDRRAQSVKAYLVSRGVSPDRLHTTSYGEETPQFDNAREETRRLNRRAALVIDISK
jgi:outer membrane protein OmpA-like peptidoglycan-associated protein